MKKLLFALGWLIHLSVSAQHNSLFWKISGNGLSKPSYLYGTMHTKDDRVFKFSDSVTLCFKSAKAFAMELDPKETFNLGLISKLMMGKDYSLKKMIPEREYRLLDSIIKKQIGFSVSMFDNVAPVLTMSLFQAGSMELNENGNEEILDMYFYKQAKKAKKKILGIETVDEQLDALNSLTYQEQADLLVQEIHAFESDGEAGKGMVQLYIEQNLDSLVASAREDNMPDKFYKAIVTDRNERMASRIADMISEQSTFVAIGALHLPGADGVIELLRKKGFVVEIAN